MVLSRPLVIALVCLATFADLTAFAQPTCDPNAHTTPTRDEIGNAMRAASSSVRACVQTRGQAEVRVEFVCDGSVSQVTVSESASVTSEERACIVRALSTVRIPPFSQQHFYVSFPFAFGR